MYDVLQIIGIGILCVLGGLGALMLFFWLSLIFGKNRNLK